jgi:outer membrane protein assembly factor BamB
MVLYGVVNRYFDTQTPKERTMHTARPFALLMATVLVLLTACSAPSARQTPFPPDTRVVVAFISISHDGTGGLEALDATTGKLIWKTEVGMINVSRPTIENGVVYAIAYEYPGIAPHVVAVRESDGKLLWRVPVTNYSGVPLITVDASTVVLLIRGGDLYALDPATGAQRWHLAANVLGGVMRHGVIYASAVMPGHSSDPTPVSPLTPAASNNTSPSTYVPQALMALNERDGSLVWQVREDVAFIPGAVNDRTIYGWGNPNGAIYAFDVQSGRQVTGLSHTAEGTPGSNIYAWGQLMAATDRFVLLADYQSNPVHTLALAAVDGKVLWDVPVNFLNSADEPAGVQITDDFIYSTEGPNYITAVRVSDGSVAWKRRFGTDDPIGLSVIGGLLFVALAPQNPYMCFDHCAHSLVSLDAATGTVHWQHDVDAAGYLAVPAQ